MPQLHRDPPQTDAAAAALRLLRRLAGALLVAALAACSHLPRDVVRPASQAIPASTDTTLGRIAADSSPDAELTGFRLLPTGSFALDARLTLARRAERSIDIQYYHIADDETGRYLLRTLRDAALRGVRVRLLMDDLYTVDEEPLLLGLAATPNVELRLFNPFPGGRSHTLTRFVHSAWEFRRVNRRMHNKLFIVDGAMAVAGGRNIANEYFHRHEQANFVDLDSFITGALVRQLQGVFDDYWNSTVVFPVRSIVGTTLSPLDLREQFDAITGGAGTPAPEPPPANDVLGYGPIAEDLDAGRLGLVWAHATVYADPPDHEKDGVSSYGLVPLENVESVRYNVIELMRRARSEVVMTSPYMIPGERGMALMDEVRRRGVKFKVLTNSLAATDEPLVHIGYKKYRTPMLRLGIELHELTPSRILHSKRLMFGSTLGRLHAKTAVVDRQQLFIGSMNFDPRSEKHNTEMGIFVDSPQLAREVLRLMDLDKLQASYRVVLGPDGESLRWLALDEDGEMTLTEEPDTGVLMRLWLRLLTPLAPEELL